MVFKYNKKLKWSKNASTAENSAGRNAAVVNWRSAENKSNN
jgi:hypothetical protein